MILQAGGESLWSPFILRCWWLKLHSSCKFYGSLSLTTWLDYIPVVNTNALLSKLEIPRHWWEGIYADLPNLRVGCPPPPQTNHPSRLHFSQIRILQFTVYHKSNSSIEPARNPGETVVFQAHIGSGGGYSLSPSRSVVWPLSEPSSWALTLTAPNASRRTAPQLFSQAVHPT